MPCSSLSSWDPELRRDESIELGPELLPEVDEEVEVDNGKMLLNRRDGWIWL